MTYDEDIFELNAKPSGKKDKKKKKTDDLLFALTSVSEDALQPASSVVDKIVAHKEEKVKKKKWYFHILQVWDVIMNMQD